MRKTQCMANQTYCVLQSGQVSKKIYEDFIAKLWDRHVTSNEENRLYLLTYKAEDDWPDRFCFAKKVLNMRSPTCIFIPPTFMIDMTPGMKQSFKRIKKTGKVILASSSWLVSALRHSVKINLKAKVSISNLVCLQEHVCFQKMDKCILFDPDVPPSSVKKNSAKGLYLLLIYRPMI